jgi:rare lipoprotein A
LIVGLAALLAACRADGNGESLGERVVPLGQPVPKGGGVYQLGQPYQVAGVWYYPREDPAYNRVGKASWYGELFHGRRTANGEIYDMERLSAAHPTLPLPVYARVTNLENNRSIVVRVNDRGPYANDRVMDVSRRSAELLGFRDKGTAQVRVQYLARAPLNGDDSYERRYLASQSWMQYASGGKTKLDASEPIAVGSIAANEPTPPTPEAKGSAASDWKVSTALGAKMPPLEPAPLAWQPSAQASPPTPKHQVRVLAGGAEVLPKSDSLPAVKGLSIQAGSFKSKENADKARAKLSGIASVDVAPLAVGGETYFRVRVGPFRDETEAVSALARVTEAGYDGAKIVAD